jgi:hypothetical protein
MMHTNRYRRIEPQEVDAMFQFFGRDEPLGQRDVAEL